MSSPSNLVVLEPRCENCARMQAHLEKMAALVDRAYRELEQANAERAALLAMLDMKNGHQHAFAA